MNKIENIAVSARVNESGQRLFAKGSRLLTEDELLEAVEEEYAEAAEDIALDRELRLVN
jgi:hypothetical protein